MIGVANYVRVDESDVADVALAVAHEDHLRGVAMAMLQHLAEAVTSNGIRYFVADILAENHAMLNVVRDARIPYERTGSSVLHIRVDLRDVLDTRRTLGM